MAVLDEFLRVIPGGFASLVIDGEPGIGKTTLWQESVRRAHACGYRVLSCRPAEAEAKLSFAALIDLFAAVSSEAFESLPPPQRRALEVALRRANPGERGLAEVPSMRRWSLYCPGWGRIRPSSSESMTSSGSTAPRPGHSTSRCAGCPVHAPGGHDEPPRWQAHFASGHAPSLAEDGLTIASASE
jgi:hypothetical protein